MEKIANNKYRVKSFTNKRDEYIVDIENMTCTCYVSTVRGKFCKHLDFVLEKEKVSQK
jgi:SWIM zinc finger.